MEQKQGSVKAAPSANHPSPAPAREQDSVRDSDSAKWAQATASTLTILPFLPDSILPTPQTGLVQTDYDQMSDRPSVSQDSTGAWGEGQRAGESGPQGSPTYQPRPATWMWTAGSLEG